MYLQFFNDKADNSPQDGERFTFALIEGNPVMGMPEELTPLQQSVLDRYKKLARSLHSLDDTFKQFNASVSGSDTVNVTAENILREIREIEIKIGLVGTLLKGSVYSLLLQRKQEEESRRL